MSEMKMCDYYYGAVLSNLFSHNVVPALIENGDKRRVYSFTTDNNEFTLFVKYTSKAISNRTNGYRSWKFTLSDDYQRLSEYLSHNNNILLALVCATEELKGSELALLDSSELKQLIATSKSSINISRKKNERYYTIAVDNKRIHDCIKIKANKLDEMLQ